MIDQECFHPICGRYVGSKISCDDPSCEEPHHYISCGKSRCDSYAEGHNDFKNKVLEYLRGPMTSNGTQASGAAADAIESMYKKSRVSI